MFVLETWAQPRRADHETEIKTGVAVLRMNQSAADSAPDFAIFHAENPNVYDELRALALEYSASGRKRGIRAIFVLRQFLAAMQGDRCVAVPQKFAVLYRELLMQEEPMLRGFFVIRNRRPMDAKPTRDTAS